MTKAERGVAVPVDGTGGRAAWPDAAKGVLIVLVVLWHSSLWMHENVNAGVEGIWRQFGLFMTPFRMPLFFFISGYLASRALARPLAGTRRRTLGLYWIYVIWSIVFLARQFIPMASTTPPRPLGILTALILPTSFWYLWALPFYFLFCFVAVRVLGRRSGWLLVPLTALALCSPLVHSWSSQILSEPYDAVKLPSVMRNLVWFYAGTQLRPLWDRMMRTASWGRLVVGVTTYAAAFALVEIFSPPSDDGSWTIVPLSFIALFVSSQLLGLLTYRSRGADVLQRLGRDTLPIYVFHLFIISAVSAVAKITHLDTFLADHLPVASSLVPPLLTVLIIPFTLWAASLIRRSPLRWLLVAPTAVVGAAADRPAVAGSDTRMATKAAE